MGNSILNALNYINVASLNYQEWINIGMALKAEGYEWTVWDEWSKNDSRYKPGECERKWKSFSGSSTPLTGGTIIQMERIMATFLTHLMVMGFSIGIQ